MKTNQVWTLGAALLASACLSVCHGAEAGFKSLFNGQDLTGWDGKPGFWSVRDGAITGETSPSKVAHTFLIYTNALPDDFELRCSYRTVPGDDKGFCNSGIQYRSKIVNAKNWVVGGYQADIEAGKTYSGILYDEAGVAGGRGVMANRGEKVVWDANGKKQVVGSLGDSAEIQAHIKPTDWNDYVIIVKGYHFQHFINGLPTVDVTDNCEAKRCKSGVLALQLHQGPPMLIQFKDIRIKPLASDKKIVLIAGGPSHGPGDHEHRAGCLLFQKCLSQLPGFTSVVYSNGWPREANAFDGADAMVIYSDGGDGHPAIQGERLKMLDAAMKRGAGLGLIHYAVEVPKDKGGPEFLAWAGGYFEAYLSVNPFWDAQFNSFPEHPITRGVKPFKMRDEWYYHMRFPEGMKDVTPILTAVPPDSTRGQPGANDAHGGNPEVQKHKGEAEHMMWAIQRPDGGRGFGFTGGHAHKNWMQEDFRKVVLNAIVWISKAEVPAQGVQCDLSEDDFKVNLDPKRR